MMSAVTWARPGARSLAPFRQNHRRRTRLHISAQETQEPAFSRVKAKWAELREKANEDLVTVIRGSGVSLERETSWSLTAAGSSAFAEVVAVSFPGDSSREYHAGYDGNSSVWQDDMSGFATLLESEDCDKNVLATWLRTGQWLGSAWSKLEYAQSEWLEPTLPSPTGVPQGDSKSPAKKQQRPPGKEGKDRQASSDDADLSTCAVFAVRRAQSAYTGWLWVDPGTGLPRRLELPNGSGGPDAWTFDWTHPETEIASQAPLVPSRTVRTNATGQRATYTRESVSVAVGAPVGEGSSPPWEFPKERQRPGHGSAVFAGPGPSVLPAARCEGGQFLIAGTLSSGKPGPKPEPEPAPGGSALAPAPADVFGWFILDTACDSAALARSAADAAGLPPRFGQQAVFGVGGPVVSALRVAPSLRLGALELSECLAMELQLDGAVRLPSRGPPSVPLGPPGAPLPLAGILGGSLLLRCVVEISAPKRVPGSKDAPQVTVTLHDPATYEPEPRVAISFQEVFFIDGAAHIRVGFNVETDASVAGQAAALEALRDLGAPEGNSDSDSGGGGGWGGGGGGKGEGRRGGPQNCAPEATSGGVADLIPRLGEQEGFGATRDGALFKVGLGLGGAPVVLGSRAARRLQFAERTVALTPSGLVSGPGSDQGRLARVEEGSVVSGRVSALELCGARFENVRCLAHVSADPPDLGLSQSAAGVLSADLFRGCKVVLDFGQKRMAVMQLK